jgi:hypothetical protein
MMTVASGVFASTMMFVVCMMFDPDGNVSNSARLSLRGSLSADLAGRANVRDSLLAFNQSTIPARLLISRTLASGCKTKSTNGTGFYAAGLQGNCSVCRKQCPNLAGECFDEDTRYVCGKGKRKKPSSGNNEADDGTAKAEGAYSSSTSFMSGVADLFEMDEEEAMAKVMEERLNANQDRLAVFDMETGEWFPVAPREFMGITNWSTVPHNVNANQANLYIQGVFFPALIFVILAVLVVIGTIVFTIGRCPCCFCGRACCFLPCFPESCCVPFLKRPCVRRCCCAKPERRVIWYGFPMCLCPRNNPVMGEGAEKNYLYSGGLQVYRDGKTPPPPLNPAARFLFALSLAGGAH